MDTRDGITVESNTGTEAELKAGLDALDAAIEKATPDTTPDADREAKTGRFTSKDRRTNPVARMAEATAREAAAKRERDEIKADRDRLAAELEASRRPPAPAAAAPAAPQAVPAAPAAPAAPDDPEPDPTKYPGGEYDTKYLRDVGKWEARQEFARLRQVEAKVAAREQHLRTVEAGMTTYAKRMQEGFADKAALDTYLRSLPAAITDLRPSAVQTLIAPGTPLGPTNVIADVISDSDKPIALMNYLRDHPDEFQRLSTLHPIQVFREMGKLEATVAAANPARPAPRESVSRARPPVQRVESVPQISDAPPGDDASDEEHAAYYNRKETARRYGRG